MTLYKQVKGKNRFAGAWNGTAARATCWRRQPPLRWEVAVLRCSSLALLCVLTLGCALEQSIGPPADENPAAAAPELGATPLIGANRAAAPATQESLGLRLDERRSVR
jgi:hypothetical protein